MIRAYLSALADNSDLSSVLLFEHRSLDKKSHARHVPQRDKFEGLWRDVVNEGIQSKIFDCPDAGMAVREGGKSIEKVADEYADLLFHGMLK